MKYFRIVIFCFLFLYPCLSFSEQKVETNFKNKLIGKCWKYKSYTNEDNKTNMELCFTDSSIKIVRFFWNFGIFDGGDFLWEKWNIKDNILYLQHDGTQENCKLVLIDGNPHFYECTPLARDILEVPWGEYIIRKKIK